MRREDSDSDEELQEIVALHGPGLYQEEGVKRKKVNNEEGLLSCLKTFSKCDLPWIERLDIVTESESNEDTAEIDANDDFKREHYIYRQAQAAVMQALPKLKKAGIATQRPVDYLSQMAKSDEHMVRVRSHLLSKQKETENREKAKKLREMRKRGKKIQQEVLQQRQKEKKEFLQSIKNYKKGKAHDLDEILDSKPSAKKKPQFSEDGKSKQNGINRKRHFKNAKYGFGGQKKRNKRNDQDSARGGERFNFKKQSNKPKKGVRMKGKVPGKKGRFG